MSFESMRMHFGGRRGSSRPVRPRRHGHIWWHLGQIVPWFYMVGVFVGVPFMSFMPYVLKLWLAVAWGAWSLLYLWLSQTDLAKKADIRGQLDESDVRSQSNDPWKILIGILLALFVWVLGIFAHWSWPLYGWVEWATLGIACLTAFVEAYDTNTWIIKYHGAAGTQKRYETERQT